MVKSRVYVSLILTGSQLKGVPIVNQRQFVADFSREKERVCINYADLIKARKAAN